MTSADRCPHCGTERTPGAPLGLCPACLLKAGLAAPTDGPPMDAGSGDGESPTYEVRPASQPERGAAFGAPEHVGPYHIQGVLGEGGMGIVYLAEQREPIARRVALKLVKPGMDSREVLRRFEAERQALALMDHPHIARVLDAGIGPGGTPYFVMEYVPGLTITDYCDRHRLTNTERLELFLPVCAAIQHAHQKGVIHRDLKPSNILVTVQDGKPVPKVIDFGIAKATHQGVVERAAFTELGMLIGTPEYMSPEQAEASGLEVDTTTDIYSLGVILYELLVGALPFDPVALRQAGITEIHRIIREQDPPKPSTRASTLGATAEEVAKRHQTNPGGLARQVRGDLDAITMKALEKDRTRRYASASEFAADLQRYLHGEAVVARPASVVYRTRKFVRRHKLGVAAGALVAAALVVGLALATTFYIRAEGARRAEERQRVVAERRGCQAAMLAADFSLRADAASDARARLEDCTEQLRGWEWHVLDRRTSSSSLTFELDGHSRDVAFQGDATVRALVLRTVRGKRVMRLVTVNLARPGGGLAMRADESLVALSRDNRLAVVTNAVSEEATVRNDPRTGFVTLLANDDTGVASSWFTQIRDVESGRVRSRFSVEGLGVWKGARAHRASVGFAPFLGGRMSWVDDTTGEFGLMSGSGPYLVDAVFDGDGTRVAAWSWGNVVGVWDTASGRQLASLRGHNNGIVSCAFLGSNRLVSASFDATARVWDLVQGRQIASLAVPGGAWAVAVSPDGRWVAAGSPDGTLRIWNAEQLKSAWSARPREGSAIYALAFSPDGRMLASAGMDSTIRLWDAATGAALVSVRAHRGSTDALAFSPDGLRLASSGDDETLRVTTLADASQRVVGYHGGEAMAVAFGPDGETLVSGGTDRMVRVWNASTGRLVRSMQAPAPSAPGWLVFNTKMEFALSPDGRLAAAGFRNDSSVYVWDTASGERVRTLAGHQRQVHDVAFNADSTRLVVMTGGVNLHAWDLATGGLVGTARVTSGIGKLVPLRDARRMLLTEGGVRTLEVETMQVAETARFGSTDVACASVDPGQSLAVVGTNGGSLAVWTVGTGAQATALRTSGPSVRSCTYSPDGRRIAAAFDDGTIGIWDAAAHDRVITLSLEASLPATRTAGEARGELTLNDRDLRNYANALAFSADGSRLATAWTDGAVRLWNGLPKSAGQRARDRVDAMFADNALAVDVADALERDSELAPDIRSEAVRQARTHVDKPSALNSAAWMIVREPGGSAEAYRRALRLAEKASAAEPTADYLNTLAAAQYRIGAYREAMATLDRTVSVRKGPSPDDLAFLAMARSMLGDTEAAREALEKLRTEAKQPAYSNNANVKGLLAEAEALIEGKSSQATK